MTAKQVSQALRAVSSPEKAKASAWFFKTGPGQYGEGDVFIGVTLPEQRVIAKKFKDLPIEEVKKLLQSKIHEERLTALIILVAQYRKADDKTKQEIASFYHKNRAFVNNWDLVDSSAPQILGDYLSRSSHSRNVLYRMAKSKSVWDRRIAMLSTFTFIKNGEAKDAFAIAELLLNDDHDLIHKAVGWMLRVVGDKCGIEKEEEFLKKYYQQMPRTMLRYAIEKFPESLRKAYLSGTI